MLMGGPMCESCGRPRPGATEGRFCDRCADARGTLLPWDEVHRRLVEEEFMARNGMGRAQADAAAREALGRMPAWKGRR